MPGGEAWTLRKEDKGRIYEVVECVQGNEEVRKESCKNAETGRTNDTWLDPVSDGSLESVQEILLSRPTK